MDNATALNRRRTSPNPRRAEHHSVNSSEIGKFLLKTNDERGERPGWAILSVTYVSAKTWERKRSISSNGLYGQALWTWYGTKYSLNVLAISLFLKLYHPFHVI